ncbi:MAG: FadR family transcriptional regulator [Treponema sp.]|jgi:DNA-binding FadR family transcriptional regulator|nr:FadR family transcriptional regulator [Treponema sp.]
MNQTKIVNISENLLTLRRRLKLSQKDFIRTYLIDGEGKPQISVSTFSNIENGGTVGVERLAVHVAEKMKVDPPVFLTDPDEFARNIDFFFEKALETGGNSFAKAGQIRKATGMEALVETISDYLMDAILRGELRPGSKLPSDRNLSAQFGVGRSTLRAALKSLSTLGIITVLPGHGTFIATDSAGLFHLPLSWTFLIGDNRISHLLAVRNILEAEAARLAAEAAPKTALKDLADIYRQMTRAFKKADFKDFLDLDIRFHLAIALCSQNPLIHDLLAISRKMLSYISRTGMVTLEELQTIFNEHSAIYQAITGRDPVRAKQAMETHLERARKRYHI